MVSPPVLVSLQGILAACSRAYLDGVPAGDVLRAVASAEFAKGRGLVHDWRGMRRAARRESAILHRCSYFAGRTAWDEEIVSAASPHARYYHLEEVLRPEFYGPRWRRRHDGPLIIYATGGPAPYKGLVSLLEAVALLRKTVHPDVVLRVGGAIEGSEMWPVALRAVDRLGLGGAVRWLGALAAPEIVSELAGAAVFVHPSFVDNSPNALAEAMILGLPCVASAVGGIPSMLSDGREGLLFEPGDVVALAAAVSGLAAEPALAARLGENAQRRAVERHEPQRVAEETVAAYEDIVGSHADRDGASACAA
jgi:glycosyltransferase involved in cell wall biosynthesis